MVLPFPRIASTSSRIELYFSPFNPDNSSISDSFSRRQQSTSPTDHFQTRLLSNVHFRTSFLHESPRLPSSRFPSRSSTSLYSYLGNYESLFGLPRPPSEIDPDSTISPFAQLAKSSSLLPVPEATTYTGSTESRGGEGGRG